MSAVRFERTDCGDGAREILTVVRIDGQTDLAIEICTGQQIGDDFVGLYDLDGAQLGYRNVEWQPVDEAELGAEEIEEIGANWESGTSTVVRLIEAVQS